MIDRRFFLLGIGVAGTAALARPALAQADDKAASFIRQVTGNLVAIVNGPQSLAEKRAALLKIVDGAVDVDGIARYCLGRFWRQASPAQQQNYVAAFHQFMVSNVSAKLGEYKGVQITVGRSRPLDDSIAVSTTVERPNNTPATVDWVVGQAAGVPKIVDLVAEGTSLRVTQRQDYASYLSQNANNIDALIQAILKQSAA
jgi:phospholipid transport system substrate-binding protein